MRNLRRGQTLLSLMVGVTVSLGVVMGAATLIQSTQRSEVRAGHQALVDTAQVLTVSAARSDVLLKYLRSLVNADTNLAACLIQEGVNCDTRYTAYAVANVPQHADFNGNLGLAGPCTLGKDCVATRSLRYRFICPSARSCTGVNVHVGTAYVGTFSAIQSRDNDIDYSRAQLSKWLDLNDSCATSSTPTRVVTGVDLTASALACTNLVSGQCTGARFRRHHLNVVDDHASNCQDADDPGPSAAGYTSLSPLAASAPAGLPSIGSHVVATDGSWGACNQCLRRCTKPKYGGQDCAGIESRDSNGFGLKTCNKGENGCSPSRNTCSGTDSFNHCSGSAVDNTRCSGGSTGARAVGKPYACTILHQWHLNLGAGSSRTISSSENGYRSRFGTVSGTSFFSCNRSSGGSSASISCQNNDDTGRDMDTIQMYFDVP